jgi:hypothetical protein
MRFTAYFAKGSRSFILPQGASQARAFEHVSRSDNWFICANSDGKVTLCGHSIGAFDGIDNSAILARLKKHFKRSIA